MARYYTFFTNMEDKEEMGGSHFNLYELSKSVEMFLGMNPKREFLFVSVCRQEDNGTVTELARWKKGSLEPVFDIREESEMEPVSEK